MTCRLEKIILALNLIVYRVDSLLANFIDGVFILSYESVMNLILERWCGNLLSIIFLSFLPHMLYFIVYVVNDLIDYGNPQILKAYLDNSFYRLRPIYYFRRSKPIIAYIILLYVTYITLISIFIRSSFYLSIFFVISVILVSIMHSHCNVTVRIFTFYLLRIIKYAYILILFNVVTFGHFYNDVAALVMLTFVLPYTMYSVINYVKLVVSRNKIIQNAIILTISITTLLIILFKAMPTKYQLMDVIKSSTICYLSITFPVFSIRQVLRKLLGATNPTYCYHILRLISGAILMLLTIGLLFYVLTLTIS
ncbi:MAG: hypothetical protein QXX41_06275 [Nitrososphaerota archaeon]